MGAASMLAQTQTGAPLERGTAPSRPGILPGRVNVAPMHLKTGACDTRVPRADVRDGRNWLFGDGVIDPADHKSGDEAVDERPDRADNRSDN